MSINVRAVSLALGGLFFGFSRAVPAADPAATQPAPTTAAAPSVRGGQPGTPPAYTPVRWNEKYTYLADPERRTDYADPLKFIPIGQDPSWSISIGGQARYRYEWFNSSNFDAGPQDDNGFHLGRLMLHADVHLSKYVRGFVQAISGLEGGRNGGARPGDQNDIDFHQAFIDVVLPMPADLMLTLRPGRQNLLYGAQRLISPLDWSNTRRTFDGFKASLANTSGSSLDFFAVHPVIVNKSRLDSYSDDALFLGLYNTLMLPEVFGKEAGTRWEAYALYLDRFSANFAGQTGGENRYTLGTRFYTNPKPWDADVELAYQFGEFNDNDISAWSAALESGYTFAAAPLSPRPFVAFDIASGDRGGSTMSTFNQLYPLGHAYFGWIDAIGRQNIVDLHPGLELGLLKDKKWVKKLSLRSEYHWFWRQSPDDAVYNAGGAVLRAAGTTDELTIGSELDLLLTWQIDRHFQAYFGYSHFFPGEFLQQTGPSGDIDFFYGALTFTF